MALMVAGERSGVGKTTVVLMLLSALRRGQFGLFGSRDGQPVSIQSFKVGPDYIDPLFHRYVTGRPCYNLDPVLTSEEAVQRCFATHQAADCVIVEGVMGLFDGTAWTAPGSKPWGQNSQFDQPQPSGFASTAHVAKLLQLPVLLVIDCSRLSGSVAAIAQGYRSLDPAVAVVGIVLNRVGSDRHLHLLKSALEPLKIPILGVLHRHREIELPHRHLGLVPTDELPELEAQLARLAAIATTAFDWPQLWPLLQALPAVQPAPESRRSPATVSASVSATKRVRIAVARDRAFNFYYAENLELLEQAGAELVFWSPLEDYQLPPDLQGLYFGGGFPEVFAQQLSANQAVRQAVRQLIQAGIPTWAECGGLMYLCAALRDLAGDTWPMVGPMVGPLADWPPTTAVMDRLTLGYRRAVALGSSPLLMAGEEVWGHEFHHSRLETEPGVQPGAPCRDSTPGSTALFELWGNDWVGARTEGIGRPHIHASYVHLHWGDRPHIAQRFVAQCQQWKDLSRLTSGKSED